MKSHIVLKKGEVVGVFLNNNFYYEGEVIDVDEISVRIFDVRSDKEKILPFNSIADITIKKKKESEENGRPE